MIAPGPLSEPKASASPRAEIARLDQDASLLRNRSQITPQTLKRMDQLARASAQLQATLPETSAAKARRTLEDKANKTRFQRGRDIYLQTQAPALRNSEAALRSLMRSNLPPALEKNIIKLLVDLDTYNIAMTVYNPSQSISAEMTRLLQFRT